MTPEAMYALKPGDRVSITYEAVITKNELFDSSGVWIAINHGTWTEEGPVAPAFLVSYGTLVTDTDSD